MTASLSSSITSFVGDHGVVAVFLLMAIDAVFPAASELVMLYAGALAGGAIPHAHASLFGARLPHGLDAYLVLAGAGTFGYLLGAWIGWAAGLVGGRPLLEQHGRWLHLTDRRLQRAEAWFGRFGTLAVFVGRLTPVVRSFISIPAGIFRVPLARYTVLTLVGSAIWAFTFAAAGWGLGSGYKSAHHSFRFADYLVAIAVIGALAAIVLRRMRQVRTARG